MGNPVSFQTSIGKHISYHPVSAEMVARKLGMNAPVSLRTMNGQLNTIPSTMSYTQEVVTPSGTPLGGSVTLNINSDGTYTVEFIMHSSSIFASFDFQLRAYLSAPGLPHCFFFYHEGHVSPTGTDDTHPEPGSNPMIPMYWNEIVQAGTFSVAHDYAWSGVAGGIANLVKDLFDIGVGAVGASIGAVIGLTREALSWLGATLGPGGTLGIVAGVVVFAVGAIAGFGVGSALILGTVAGVAVGAVTNALVKTRNMSATEIALAQAVFKSELAYENVLFTNLNLLGGRAFTAPGVDGKTYCSFGKYYNDSDMTESVYPSYPNRGELMIHELTHAWQIAHNSFLPGFVCSGVVNGVNYKMGDDVYAYGGAGPDWSSFNLEQQGQIVNEWFGGEVAGTGTGSPQSQWALAERNAGISIIAGSGGFSITASANIFTQADVGKAIVAGAGVGYVVNVSGATSTDPSTGTFLYPTVGITVGTAFDLPSYPQGKWWLRGMNTANPYYKYISANILTGTAGFSATWL